MDIRNIPVFKKTNITAKMRKATFVSWQNKHKMKLIIKIS